MLAGMLYLEPTLGMEARLADVITRLWGRRHRLRRYRAGARAPESSSPPTCFAPGLAAAEAVAPRRKRGSKAIYIHSHMDEDTFDTDRIRQCCVGIREPDGTKHPVVRLQTRCIAIAMRGFAAAPVATARHARARPPLTWNARRHGATDVGHWKPCACGSRSFSSRARADGSGSIASTRQAMRPMAPVPAPPCLSRLPRTRPAWRPRTSRRSRWTSPRANLIVAAYNFYPDTVSYTSLTDTQGNTFTLLGPFRRPTAGGSTCSTRVANTTGPDTVTVTIDNPPDARGSIMRMLEYAKRRGIAVRHLGHGRRNVDGHRRRRARTDFVDVRNPTR